MLRVLLTSALISHTSTYINYICLNISRVLISLTRLLITLHQYYTSKHLTRVLIINFQLANMQAIYGQCKIYLFHTSFYQTHILIHALHTIYSNFDFFMDNVLQIRNSRTCLPHVLPWPLPCSHTMPHDLWNLRHFRLIKFLSNPFTTILYHSAIWPLISSTFIRINH